MSFGSLLIYDLKDCNNFNNMKDIDVLQYFINNIIKIMNMNKVGNTVFEYFESNEFNIVNDLVGFSITQIISMSSITVHICELSKSVYIDIFTCCNINDDILYELKIFITYIFDPSNIQHKLINR